MTKNSQHLLERLPEAIFQFDADGFVRYVNPTVTKITGYSPEEWIGRTRTLLYLTDEDSIKAEYEFDMAVREGRFLSEGWRRRKDGSQYWGELLISPLKNESGELEGFVAILRDTTRHKEHEVELRRSEERYRLMVEGVHEYGIFLLDTTGHILTWNDGAQRIKGYRPSEIIGKHFSTFYTSEDLESKKPERELKIAVATGKYEEEGWRVRKNGSVFWANIVITALLNEQNKLVGFSKVTRDLTERRMNEEALRQSEERYRSLVEQVVDYGIFMLDERGRIVSWNEGARRISGYNSNEIIGKYFSIFYPEEDIINGKPAHELRVARADGMYTEEGWRLRKDGTRFWASVLITAVYGVEGNLIGFSKVTRDLTERKASERALRDSYEQYRMLADELRHTNTELSAANEELEQFTSIVSHDLQEPIRTIKSFLQLIELKLTSGEQENLTDYIGKSIAAADRMRELIRNLLHYSQLSKGELEVRHVPVNDILQEALQNLKSVIDRSHARILIENEVEWVEGDRVQLVQLVQNLLSNAIKFTDAESPRIHILVRAEGNTARFSITDNGIGISEADLSKVFEIFRRLHTEKKYPGTGIGLAICKKIVDRHQGQIWPESQSGGGTTFHFTLNNNLKENTPA
ncbi:PAS domain-containing sensor histidine kinase [Flaviaesturariibacter flavus]|uniref:histidine kinase n=1 Tax=Flaviaesturariibacter flavus TaxID=2502780 RepID=A0A4R1BPZ5_9BACT|nr:PAS domain-containing sensor histidine kinase [Flaviaesturariibacter flavus]TCJ19346.1 PAS domain-containing sensor histidine kinase [Flaviaesturariibacter flavus]